MVRFKFDYQACLEEFSWNAEQVVHALLEDKIPPALQDMDRQIERFVKV